MKAFAHFKGVYYSSLGILAPALYNRKPILWRLRGVRLARPVQGGGVRTSLHTTIFKAKRWRLATAHFLRNTGDNEGGYYRDSPFAVATFAATLLETACFARLIFSLQAPAK